ncbi:leukocyte receptor cluster member 1 [Cocos nucifera]|uniref:Leukocyte receptor cluster member 1 n=1 Tax=Cocos nucifera TaxID=13894 RepID=A0A8K0N4L1_COCNU|nr:leukocyte receptor cluster member 1 [Cocos nucifera]
MGGHGGLNILPQKRWNVYNYENREKVRRDEEAAAREEQLEREQSRRRDAEFRLERLRQARGLSSSSASAAADTPSSDSHHINLFDGLADFSSLGGAQKESKKYREDEAEDSGPKKSKKQRREERPPAVSPEDEKYKLGYGLVGKGVKAPWYLSRSSSLSEDVDEGIKGRSSSASVDGSGKKNGGKKTIEELREERVRREKQEKGRERALLASVAKKGVDRGFSRRHL